MRVSPEYLRWPRQWTLPTRVTVAVAALLIPLLGILLIFYAHLGSERRAAEISNASEVAQAIASTVDAFARDLESTALATAIALGRQTGPLDQAELGPYLRSLSDEYAVLRGLFLVDSDGHVLASASGAGIGLDLSQRPYMQSLRQGASTVWGPGIRGLESGEITVTFGRTVRGPDGAVRGYLVAAFYPPALVDRLDIGRATELDLTLIDSQGLILHSTTRPDLPFERRDVSQPLHATAPQDGQVVSIDGPTALFSGEPRYGALVLIPRTGWVLVASRPLDILDERLRAQFLYQAGAMSGVVLTAAALLALLTRRLVRPITRLANVAAAIERGERPIVLEESSDPEVAQLAAGMRTMSAAVADREDDLRRQSVRLEVLAGASQAFAAARLDRQTLFDTIAQWVADRIGDGCSVSLVSDDARHFETLAVQDPRPEVSLEVLRDVAPEQPEDAARHGLHSVVSVPLRLQDQVIGKLSAWRDSPNRPYTRADVALLQDLADRASLAIGNIRSYDAEQRAHAAAEHLASIAQQIGASLAPEIVHDQIVRAATELLGSTFAGIFLLDDAGDFVLSAAQGLATGRDAAVRLPRAHSAAGRAVAERQTIVVEDARTQPDAALPRLLSGESVGSLVVAPIFIGAEPVGAVEVYSPVPHAFAPEAARLLTSLAAPAAVAITNARLHHDAQEQAATQAMLNRALQDAADARDAALSEAEAARAHLHELFMQAPAAIAVLRGPEHIFEFANPRYQQLVGGRSVVGKAIRRVLSEIEGQGIFELLDSVFASGQPFLGNEVYLRWDRNNDGALEEGFLNFVYQPYRRPDGGVEGILVHAVDVTELVQARVRVETLAADREAFLATASHDLKNPLTALTGTTQILRRHLARSGTVTPERLATGLATIEETAAQMLELINQMLDVTRLRMGQQLDLDPRPTDLVALVQRAAAAQQQATENRRIAVETSASEIVGNWDAARLRRVIGNLLGNALKYSPAGGDVAVSTAIQDGWAVLGVRDHGVGIPAADLPFIFDWYRRGSNVADGVTGSGIGLAGAKRIIDQHGGTITVLSEEGGGSEFIVRLPLPVA